MSIEVSFRPLYGSGNDGPLASVLDIDGFKILLDCGWAEPYNTDLLIPLKEYVRPLLSLHPLTRRAFYALAMVSLVFIRFLMLT
jgi:hypothetical protein